MSAVRFTRAATRATAQLRAPLQRRFASTAENEFIKERQHIKEHAAGTTGKSTSDDAELGQLEALDVVADDGQSCGRRSPSNRSGVAPCLIAAGANAYWLWNEHWEHWNHMPPLEERTEYPYQNIRTKNYQWGNGDKTLFWNDEVNYHNKDKAS
ncbi:cytochrome c oxidase subunit 6a [Fusarium sp. NRRL 25303]|nr:cytochrome c oxidase subunit 6a [Fusarium sp. NRRL 25303]